MRWVCEPRWWLLLLITLIVYGALLLGEAPTWTWAQGVVSATEQESQECYLTIRQTVVMFHPMSENCVIARQALGRRGRLVFVVED